MWECLELTLGCWKEIGIGGYRSCGPSRSEKWSKKLMEKNMMDWRSKRFTLAEWCFEDSEEDACDSNLLPETSGNKPNPIQESEKFISVKNWLTLRVRLENQVIQCRAPDICFVGAFKWHRLPDRELDRLSFRLRHYCPDWLKSESDFANDEHHNYLGVYVPETNGEPTDSEDWYIGQYIMGQKAHTIEYLYEDSFVLYRQCFTYEPSMASGALTRGHAKKELYEGSTTYWDWVPIAHREVSTSDPPHYLVPSLSFVPFLIRVLLTQRDLVGRLCDVNDESLTPYSFLLGVQQIQLDSQNTSVFGCDIKVLLRQNSRVFKLEPSTFWDLNQEIGPDPTMSRPKFDLLCSDGLDPWLYVCRSLACFEKSSQHDALEWIFQKYPGLAPFNLCPIEAKLRLQDGYDPLNGSRGMSAILDLNLPSEQFVPPPYDPEKGGMFGTFQVGRQAGVLHVRKLEYWRH
eukprot:Protomagalhaensia_wolfi_Nauph_80__5878@NODE_758_length_2025_cov_5_787009_g569_i0_p1_GENE_NODE_758_length_2025_cov_5_787009_g569_i0NODE_758_length_2025_cov_5_787009_g569_i0_p1_ORF_typecomplete_len459_score70_05HPIH/PF13323_6/58HPIH/PF13323_6/2_3HPIH/PF13323_6/2_9e03_NODE_758_length_2025_cov_5_787009_g569_i03091685